MLSCPGAAVSRADYSVPDRYAPFDLLTMPLHALMMRVTVLSVCSQASRQALPRGICIREIAMRQRVITISRERGSGADDIAVLVAKALDIPLYDHQVITRAAE